MTRPNPDKGNPERDVEGDEDLAKIIPCYAEPYVCCLPDIDSDKMCGPDGCLFRRVYDAGWDDGSADARADFSTISRS